MIREKGLSASYQDLIINALHMLRHSYATPSWIRYSQEVLGYSSLKTTQVYTHVARQYKPVSPLDSLDDSESNACDFGGKGRY